MISWSWHSLAIKRRFRVVNGSTPVSTNSSYWDGEITWVTPEDLGRVSQSTVLSSRRTLTREGYRACGASLVPPGSLVISTRAPIGHLAVAGVELCSNQGCRSLVPLGGVDSKFYYYVLTGFRPLIEAEGRGSTFSELGASDLGDFRVPAPPLATQTAIADFLDRKTTAIDALIEKKERMIELLVEKRAALVHRAVTRGLDPDVPMKDSGIPWIGEIPAHWEVRRLKHLVVESIAGPYGSSLTKAMYTSEGVRVYGQQQVIPDDFAVGDYYISEEKFRSMKRYEVRPGDLLISVMGTIGRVAVVPEGAEQGIINPRLVLYRTDLRLVNVRFLQLAISSEACQAPLNLTAQGSTMDGLNMGILGDLRIPIPPLNEQASINKTARGLLVQNELTTSTLLRQIDRLKEYRQALITQAVTGQLDIPDAA